MGMKVSEEFPSKYLKAADIKGQPTVVISHAAEEPVGKAGTLKWVLYFVELQKPLILNATNSHELAKHFGDDSDDWGGGAVTLFVEETALGPGVRVRPSPRAVIEKELSDKIPF